MVTEISCAQDYPQYRAVGSPFVPLDSWAYPALEYLAALGYVQTALTGLKPWTRAECARLTDEAEELLRKAILGDRPPNELAAQFHAALTREFAFELEALGGGGTRSAHLESVYARVMSISGPALTDGFHFGQTIGYDFGRPFRRGTNLLGGASGRATAGPLAFYLRAEFQDAPAAPTRSEAELNLIVMRDLVPRHAVRPFSSINRVVWLDTYASMNFRNLQFSVGKQSLSWGVGEGGSLLLSNNAEPIYMARLTRVVPQLSPGFLRRLGPLRWEFFLGRLVGHAFVPRPYIYGQKVSFKPSPYFEVGYGRSTMIGGRGGSPFTTRNFFKSFFGISSGEGRPGNSMNALDVVARIPLHGNSLLLYAELYQDDEPIYFYRAGRGVLRPGGYIPQLPGLPRLDFRFEAASSESWSERRHQGNLNYWHLQYRDGYTNRGNLLGNTVGRMGRTLQFWTTCRFSPAQSLQFSFKQSRISAAFVPRGGTWYDYSLRHEWRRPSGFYARSFLQFERVQRFPLLFQGHTANVTASVELGFMPQAKN